jgi:hypothetical protein
VSSAAGHEIIVIRGSNTAMGAGYGEASTCTVIKRRPCIVFIGTARGEILQEKNTQTQLPSKIGACEI